NFWFQAENFDLQSLGSALGLDWKLPDQLPKLDLTITGDGENVRTRGHLDFPKPLNLQLDPWNIPTNLISQPLVSFTAIRGFGPWLGSLRAWQDLNIGPPPNQACVWALQSPMQAYIAAPSPDASNKVSKVTDLV